MKAKTTVKRHYPLKMNKTRERTKSKWEMVHIEEEQEREHYEKEIKVIRSIFGGLT